MTLALYWTHPHSVAATDQNLAMLSADELTQYHRFITDAKRQEYLATRVLVRTVLGTVEKCQPSALQFERNKWGRPSLLGSAVVKPGQFNLSHTDGLVVCLLSNAYEVGIDTEALSRAPAVLRLARRVLAPAELAELAALPVAEQAYRALAIWTLKESYIKARGRGMSLRLSGIAFSFDGPLIQVALDPDVREPGERWRFFMHTLGSHLISIAVRLPRAGSEPVELSESALVFHEFAQNAPAK